jgi:integrase
VVEQAVRQIGIERFGAHDLRRTCAKLCRRNGGDLEQVKFLLGHSSIQTTEHYLGSEQLLRCTKITEFQKQDRLRQLNRGQRWSHGA